MRKKIIIITSALIVLFSLLITINKLTRDKDNKNNNDNNNNEKVDYRESLSLVGDLTSSLYYYTRTNFSSKYIDNNLYFYKNDSMLVSKANKEILMNILFYKLERMDMLNVGYISESTVKKEFNNIFGNNVLYSKIDNFIYNDYQISYSENYSKNNEPSFYFDKTDSNSTNIGYVSEIVSVFKYDDRIEITEVVAFINDNGTYSDSDYKNKISDDILNKENILSEVQKLNKYKYTFNYNKTDDNYYFYSYEKE